MAEIYKFFNSAPGDPREYFASDFANYFSSVLSAGLLLDENEEYGLQVTHESGLQTVVSPGKALIKGYSYENTTPLTLTHDLPEMTFDRIDRIVLRLDLRNQHRYIRLFVKAGKASENPEPPEPQRDQFIYELSLAQVRLRANAASIDPADITDERALEDVCGIVQSLITVPTSVFQQQFDVWFNNRKEVYETQMDNWKNEQQTDFEGWKQQEQADFVAWVQSLREVLDENAAGNLLNLINQNANEITQVKQQITSVEDEIAAHKAEKVHQGEIHGFRLTDGKLEYFDGQEWQRVKGDGYPVGNVSNFSAKGDDKQVILTWNDPDDVTVTDSNNNVITIARWKGTKILRKTGSYPQNESDGVLVVDNGIRNQYAENGFVDTGLTNGITYYYMAFPYTEEDVYTVDEVNRVEATPTEQRIYGVRIDKNNSNPETRVTYIGDAVGFIPMRGNNGYFQWGSWKEVFESFEIRPVVLQNRRVQYYLDPNDFTKKIDGSPANLTGTDGDVMIEFGKPLWWKWTDEGTTYTIEISDKEFDGAVKHAFEIEEGYNLVPYYALLLTQILFVIFFKSTDSQTALGRGYVDGNTSYASTGNTNNKGMFYGSGSGSQQMKFLGIEDYWGNKFWWIDGLVTDSNYNLLIGKGNFNDSGSGYQSFASGVSSDIGGYINSVQGGNEKGFIIKSGSGSETTYYADYGRLYSARVAYFGGVQSFGSSAGFTTLLLSNSGSNPSGGIGARLFCASNGKIYIGAYLGTTQSGKLRSVSGTSEPTGDKTIGNFRTEARANN
jgi:hypothetical protein